MKGDSAWTRRVTAQGKPSGNLAKVPGPPCAPILVRAPPECALPTGFRPAFVPGGWPPPSPRQPPRPENTPAVYGESDPHSGGRGRAVALPSPSQMHGEMAGITHSCSGTEPRTKPKQSLLTAGPPMGQLVLPVLRIPILKKPMLTLTAVDQIRNRHRCVHLSTGKAAAETQGGDDPGVVIAAGPRQQPNTQKQGEEGETEENREDRQPWKPRGLQAPMPKTAGGMPLQTVTSHPGTVRYSPAQAEPKPGGARPPVSLPRPVEPAGEKRTDQLPKQKGRGASTTISPDSPKYSDVEPWAHEEAEEHRRQFLRRRMTSRSRTPRTRRRRDRGRKERRMDSREHIKNRGDTYRRSRERSRRRRQELRVPCASDEVLRGVISRARAGEFTGKSRTELGSSRTREGERRGVALWKGRRRCNRHGPT